MQRQGRSARGEGLWCLTKEVEEVEAEVEVDAWRVGRGEELVQRREAPRAEHLLPSLSTSASTSSTTEAMNVLMARCGVGWGGNRRTGG